MNMSYRGLFFFILAVAASSLHADTDRQRLDSGILSTSYYLSIPADSLPIAELTNYYVKEGELTDFYVNILVKAKFSLFSLMGEPVVFCTATWQLDDITRNSVSVISGIPLEVLKKIELYDLKLEWNLGVQNNGNAVACDAGVPYPNGSVKPSFNVPASPNWDQLFHSSVLNYGQMAGKLNELSEFLTEEKAKEHFVYITRIDKRLLEDVRVLNAKIDVSQIKYYVLEQQKEQLQKIQASLAKPTQSNQQQNDADLFSQVVEKAFVEKQIQQVSKKITQSRNSSSSTERSASINHEKKQRLQQQCAGFAMPTMSLEQLKITDDNLSACRSFMDIGYGEPTQWEKEGLAIIPHWLTPSLILDFYFEKDNFLEYKDDFRVSFVGHPKKVSNVDEYHRTLKDFKDVALSALKRDTDIHNLVEQCKGALSNICRMSYGIGAVSLFSIDNRQYLHWAGYDGPIDHIGKESCDSKWQMDNYAQCKYMPERYRGAGHVILVAE